MPALSLLALCSLAAFDPSSCPGQENLTQLVVQTGYLQDGEPVVTPTFADGAPNLVLYQGTAQVILLQLPSWSPAVPAGQVHARAVAASANCCEGALAASTDAGGSASTLVNPATSADGRSYGGVYVNLVSGFYKLCFALSNPAPFSDDAFTPFYTALLQVQNG